MSCSAATAGPHGRSGRITGHPELEDNFFTSVSTSPTTQDVKPFPRVSASQNRDSPSYNRSSDESAIQLFLCSCHTCCACRLSSRATDNRGSSTQLPRSRKQGCDFLFIGAWPQHAVPGLYSERNPRSQEVSSCLSAARLWYRV